MIGRILSPIEGNADSVRSLAAALTSGAAKLSAINGVLVNIKAGASWDSPSGELFEQSVKESPPLLDALTHRYAGAAAALREFAGELGAVQSLCQASIDWKKAEDKVYAALDVQMNARMDAAQEFDDLLRLQNQVLANINQAERNHALAWERFEDADRRLARKLRVLAEDILDDSWHYTALATVQGVAQGLASLPAPVKRFPVLGQILMVSDAVSAVSQGALLVFYDEGSWKEFGINISASVTVAGAGALKSGALVGSRPVWRVADRQREYLGESKSTKDRFVIGTLDHLHEKHPNLGKLLHSDGASRLVVPLDAVPALASTKGLPLKQKVQMWSAHGQALARRKGDEAFFENWRAVSTGGANAQKMFLAGSTLEKVAPQVAEATNDALGETPAKKGGAPTYP